MGGRVSGWQNPDLLHALVTRNVYECLSFSLSFPCLMSVCVCGATFSNLERDWSRLKSRHTRVSRTSWIYPEALFFTTSYIFFFFLLFFFFFYFSFTSFYSVIPLATRPTAASLSICHFPLYFCSCKDVLLCLAGNDPFGHAAADELGMVVKM